MELMDNFFENVSSENNISDAVNDFVDREVIELDGNDYMQRFSGADWFDSAGRLTVAIIGLGGIGSHAALSIAKLGCKVILNDFDYVENVNMSGQNYMTSDISRLKTSATVDKLLRYGIDENNISCIDSNLLDDNYSVFPNANIYVLALDSIDTRRAMYRSILSKCTDIASTYIIDGRLTAETLQVFTCNTKSKYSIDRYFKSFFDKKDAMPTVCSFKQTFYMASMIGNIIANLIVNISINRSNEFYVPVPSFIEYNSRTLDYKYEV